MNCFSSPLGDFILSRTPANQPDPANLQAWDAADHYLLEQVNETDDGTIHPRNTLILNDNFGALSVALAARLNKRRQESTQGRPGKESTLTLISDSFLAHQALATNLTRNGLPDNAVLALDSLAPLSGHYDLVIIKIPKTLALLEDELFRIRPHLHATSRIIGTGMVKSIHTSTLALFERIIGPTRTSLAKKKARLIHCEFDESLQPGSSPYPTLYTLPDSHHLITNHANVFSRQRLDIGTRLFIEHLPKTDRFKDIIDLGCGNGIVGLLAAVRNPAAQLHFVDESFMALASARSNFRHALGEQCTAQFQAGDCLQGFAPDSADLILNNPPFHQQHVVGDHIAREMFRQSHLTLRDNGELWVIGNRHLGYHSVLRKLFGNCELVASNEKFVVLRATKQPGATTPTRLEPGASAKPKDSTGRQRRNQSRRPGAARVKSRRK